MGDVTPAGKFSSLMKLIANLAHIDRQAIEDCGIPGLTLMELAGQRVAEAVMRHGVSEAQRASVLIACGPGNNGGDGFVCARLLAQVGTCDVTILHTTATYRGDAAVNFQRLQKFGIPMILLDESLSASVRQAIQQADILVDALFGSGLSRNIEGVVATLIQAMNRHTGAVVIAIDLPSGIDGQTGQVWGTAIEADETVTFATAKPGLYLQPGKALAGRVDVADIGIPPALIEADDSPIRLVTSDLARAWLPKRHPAGHKYTFGSVVVVAGSRAMPGAAILSGEAALCSGCGYVTLAAPDSVFTRIHPRPEMVRASLPETTEGFLALAALQPLLQTIHDKKANTIAIGPGLGHSPETVLLLAHLLQAVQHLKPLPTVILDADALNALAMLRDAAFVGSLPSTPPEFMLGPNVILTPHVGECARLLGREAVALNADLPAAAHDTQAGYGAQVVLKSATTVTATADGLLWINATGNSGMGTAGSGDVLTGLTAGLAAQGAKPEIAARLAPYLHGRAGDFAAEALTPYCLCAGDIIHYLPHAFKELMA